MRNWSPGPFQTGDPKLMSGKGFDWLLFHFLHTYSLFLILPAAISESLRVWTRRKKKKKGEGKKRKGSRKGPIDRYYCGLALIWWYYCFSISLQDLVDSIRVNWGNFWTADAASEFLTTAGEDQRAFWRKGILIDVSGLLWHHWALVILNIY